MLVEALVQGHIITGAVIIQQLANVHAIELFIDLHQAEHLVNHGC